MGQRKAAGKPTTVAPARKDSSLASVARVRDEVAAGLRMWDRTVGRERQEAHDRLEKGVRELREFTNQTIAFTEEEVGGLRARVDRHTEFASEELGKLRARVSELERPWWRRLLGRAWG